MDNSELHGSLNSLWKLFLRALGSSCVILLCSSGSVRSCAVALFVFHVLSAPICKFEEAPSSQRGRFSNASVKSRFASNACIWIVESCLCHRAGATNYRFAPKRSSRKNIKLANYAHFIYDVARGGSTRSWEINSAVDLADKPSSWDLRLSLKPWTWRLAINSAFPHGMMVR